jgi:ribosome-binding protein aMBF1 (putative translation factor)
MLSPMDWVLIESWKERSVPLHVVLRAIEHAFDSHEAKKRKRTVKTLLYCQEEVEAQFAEWTESRVGGHDDAASPADEEDDAASPFPRPAIQSHLTRQRGTLEQLAQERRPANQKELAEALSRAAALLSEIETDYATAAVPDARKLEDSLTGIERMLDDAIEAAVSDNELEAARAEIDAQLKPYQRHMDKAAVKQTRDNLLRKRLREHFGVPRLSLFFL